MRRIAALTALVLLALAAAARAQDADPVADLRAQLEAYERRSPGEISNTIPLEKAILAVLDAGRADALAEFAGHAEMGALVLPVACEGMAPPPGKDARPPKALEDLAAAFAARGVPDRVDASVAFAALRTDAARAALAALASEAEVKEAPPLAARVRAARVRAGDAAVLAEARKALAAKDPDEVARALLVLGDSRSPDVLPDLLAKVSDPRAPKAALESAWPQVKTTTSADGLTTTSEQVPVPLPTVGDVAVEAANRLCAPPLPGMIAWWAWPEKGARFERSPAGLAALRAFGAQDAKAQKAGAIRAVPAVAAVLHLVRRTAEEGTEVRFASATFDRTWTVVLAWGDANRTAAVDAAGRATLK